MAMNKKEQAEMVELREQLRLAKALRWPDYPNPQPIDTEIIPYNKPMQGWYQHVYSGYKENLSLGISLGCSTNMYHSISNPEKTTMQRPGIMYKTRLEALYVARHEWTLKCATGLAQIDSEIEKESQKMWEGLG